MTGEFRDAGGHEFHVTRPPAITELPRQQGRSPGQQEAPACPRTRNAAATSSRRSSSYGSGPAMIAIMIAASMASRASGPEWSRVQDSGITP